jgi:hypothetical protein
MTDFTKPPPMPPERRFRFFRSSGSPSRLDRTVEVSLGGMLFASFLVSCYLGFRYVAFSAEFRETSVVAFLIVTPIATLIWTFATWWALHVIAWIGRRISGR